MKETLTINLKVPIDKQFGDRGLSAKVLQDLEDDRTAYVHMLRRGWIRDTVARRIYVRMCARVSDEIVRTLPFKFRK